MSIIEFLLLLIVAAVCGAIGRAIVGYSHGGCFISMVLGFIGAFLGTIIYVKLGLPAGYILRIGNVNFPLIWAIIGATLFVAVINLISGRRSDD